MVTTTTKTLNYSITKGSSTNSVNATITSTPGFNSNYLGKVPGILKLLELILAITALALIASRAEISRSYELQQTRGPIYRWDNGQIDSNVGNRLVTGGQDNRGINVRSYQREHLLVGESYFLAANSAAMTILIIVLISYLFHTTSAMITPKATTLENVMNLVLALMLLAAGITEIVMTVMWRNDPDIYTDSLDKNGLDLDRNQYYRPIMNDREFSIRIAAGALAILNGILFIVSLVLSRKELEGPKTL